jgi:uncharacterized membrane protein YdjX (TVP38/TMEM64 family)
MTTTTKVSKQPGTTGGRAVTQWRRWQLWAAVAGSIGLFLALWWLSEPLTRALARGDDLRRWILGFGPLSPLVYMAVFALQVLIAPVPGHFMGIMGGYLFGVLLGSLYSIAGLTIGAGLAMTLARTYGRPLLDRFFEPAQITSWEKKLRMRSPFTWWLLFIFPVADLIFYVAGLSSVPLRVLLVALIAGRGSGLLIANVLGHWTGQLAPEVVLIAWAIIGVLGVLAYFHQRRLRLMLLLSARRVRRWGRQWRPTR